MRPVRLLRAAATVGAWTLVSRLLGFLRDVAIAAVLGAGIAADAFFVAFKLANLLRRLFAEGAFQAAFVPLFTRLLEEGGRQRAARFAAEALALMALALLLVVAVVEAFMPWVVRAVATGFAPDGPRYRLAVDLARITFPYLFFISLTALLAGVLNGLGRFAAAAFAPVLLNVSLLFMLGLAVLGLARPPYALAWGVLVAGLAQLLLLARAVRRAGLVLRPARPGLGPEIRKLFRLMLPGLFGAGVYQVNLLIDTWFASLLPAGAVSYLFYADRLTQLPLGVVGVALGTALLPALARSLRAGAGAEARALQARAVEFGLLLALPAALGLHLLALPVVQGLFERGAFDAEASRATAAALKAFALGLPAYVLVKIFAAAFFAREDTRTPVLVAALCLVVNVLLILALIGPLAHVGIALATALANWVNAGLLALLLARRAALGVDRRLVRRLFGIALAALAMAAVLWPLLTATASWSPLVRLAVLVGTGALAYAVCAPLFGAFDPREVRAAMGSRGVGT